MARVQLQILEPDSSQQRPSLDYTVCMGNAPERTRRDDYSDQTRAAVIEAARRLLAQNGFIQTKVDDIAKVSRVSPATVYAQCGGKQGLLRSLVDSWTQSPLVGEAILRCIESDDAAIVMQSLAGAYLVITKEWGDVIKTVIDVAPHDDEYAAMLSIALRRHSQGLMQICRHL